jgi:hypothetical protein
MNWNQKNIAKVSEALKLAGFPSVHGIVKDAEVADMADIRQHITTERSARNAARSIAEAYGESAIKYWEKISEEELAERLAAI